MLYIAVFYISLIAIVAVAFLAGLSDWRGLVIPNRFSVIIIACFFAGYGAACIGGFQAEIFAPFLAHLLSAAVVFVITFLMFAFRLMGAADSKLATAYALWLGLNDLPAFLVVWSISGAGVAIMAKLCRNWEKWPKAAAGSDLAGLKEGQNAVPYGVAIGLGAVAALFHHGYFMAFLQL